jgi:hypothetical protein
MNSFILAVKTTINGINLFNLNSSSTVDHYADVAVDILSETVGLAYSTGNDGQIGGEAQMAGRTPAD